MARLVIIGVHEQTAAVSALGSPSHGRATYLALRIHAQNRTPTNTGGLDGSTCACHSVVALGAGRDCAGALSGQMGTDAGKGGI